jgi:hypothetical protein
MKFRKVISVSVATALGLVFQTLGVDGTAITVAWRSGAQDWGCSPAGAPECGGIFRGQLVRYTIAGNASANRQVIIDRDRALVSYPAFNVQGTKIAFYRDRKTVVNNKVVDAGKCYIAVANADGSGITNLAAINDLPDEECALDWPAGNWIYYVNPKAGTNPWDRPSRDIWRVNTTNPSQNEFVVSEQSEFRRFSLSLDAKHMGCQLLNVGGSYLKSFPGLVEEHNNCGCNGAGSASGKYMVNYCGWHGQIHFTTTSGEVAGKVITVSQLEQWSGKNNICTATSGEIESGCGGELMVWSVNSDKWSCHWPGVDGWADGMSHGTNFVLVNWVDNQAICLTNYSRIVDGNPGGSGVISFGEYSGDFWISGHAGKYETATGQWIDIPGYTTEAGPSLLSHGHGIRTVEVRDGVVRVAIDGNALCNVEIVTTQGRVVKAMRASNAAAFGADGLPRGTYLARVRTGGMSDALRFTID